MISTVTYQLVAKGCAVTDESRNKDGTSRHNNLLSDVAAEDCSILVKLLVSKQYDAFIQNEPFYYYKHIKSDESAENYALHYNLLTPILKKYGETLRRRIGERTSSAEAVTNSVCYFLPNLDNDLAHISILAGILRGLRKKRGINVCIAGFSGYRNEIGSSTIRSLRDDEKIPVYAFPESDQALVEFLKWFNSASLRLLVCYSIPRLLPAFIEALGQRRVAWQVSKFEIDSFRELMFGITGLGKNVQANSSGSTVWYRVPGTLPADLVFRYEYSPRNYIRLISINREEKIKSKNFLNAIIAVLKSDTNLHFSWTGRDWDSTIREQLDRGGVGSRHTHLGWVDHKEILPTQQIFTDAFSLSGTIAAAAFASGMPTIFMRGSNSFLEAAEEQILNSGSGQDRKMLGKISACLADSESDYKNKLREFIKSLRAGYYDGQWQRDLAQKYFTDISREVDAHRNVLMDILDKQ